MDYQVLIETSTELLIAYTFASYKSAYRDIIENDSTL